MCARWRARSAATAISCCRGIRYPFRLSSGQAPTATAPAFISTSIPARVRSSADLDGVLAFDARAPRFEGAVTLAAPAGPKADARRRAAPWRISAKVKADPAGGPARPARGELRRRRKRAETRRQRRRSLRRLAAAARRAVGAAARCRQVCSPRTTSDNDAEPARVVPALRALMSGDPARRRCRRKSNSAPSRSCWAGARCRISPPICAATRKSWTIDRLDFRAPGATAGIVERRRCAGRSAGNFKAALSVESSDPDTLAAWLQGRSEIVLSQPKAAAPARQCQRGAGSALPSRR